MSIRAMRRAHARNLKANGRRSRRVAAGAGALLSAGALLAPAAEAATFNVTTLSDAGSGSLRDAISQANADPAADTITFQPGLSGQVNLLSELPIDAAIDIQGPGAAQIALDGGDATRIFRANADVVGDPGDAVSISGLTLTDGSAAGSGGALYAQATDLTLDSVTVSDSAAMGGGKYSPGNGGGVGTIGNFPVTITGSLFTGNESSKYGGGLSTSNAAEVSITGTTFADNVAAAFGGGASFYDQNSDIAVEGSTITGNEAGGGDGGGLWFEDVYNGGVATVADSTIAANTASGEGGGISFGENFYGPTSVVNSTLTGNTAAAGGGIHFADLMAGGSFALSNSTVTGNEATDAGGGVYQGYVGGSYSDSALAISSSVVSGNTAATSGPDVGQAPNLSPGSDLTIGNSLIEDPAGATYAVDPAGTVITGRDPALGPLADNGGPTQTMLPDPASPLVDAGQAEGLTADQRGLARTVDYPGVAATLGSDGTDIGAAELAAPAPPAPPEMGIKNPFLSIESPQLQDADRVEVAVQAGAGEPVTGQVYGVITIGKGNAVQRTQQVSIPMDGRSTITVEPKTKAAEKRILRALGKGRKVRAQLTGKLVDAESNEFTQDLEAKLKAKKPRRK